MLDAGEVYTTRDSGPSGEELEDVRLSAADRLLVKRLIARAERRLGVDGLMFAAAGFEDAALRRRRAEESRHA